MLTFGAGSAGQLGHGSLLSPDTPTRVDALQGKQICQVAAGRYVCKTIKECALMSRGTYQNLHAHTQIGRAVLSAAFA